LAATRLGQLEYHVLISFKITVGLYQWAMAACLGEAMDTK